MNFTSSISAFVRYAEQKLTQLADDDHELKLAAKAARSYRAKVGYQNSPHKYKGLTPEQKKQYKETVEQFDLLKELGFSGRRAAKEIGVAESSIRYMRKQLEQG